MEQNKEQQMIIVKCKYCYFCEKLHTNNNALCHDCWEQFKRELY